jgi:hypothetical protein
MRPSDPISRSPGMSQSCAFVTYRLLTAPVELEKRKYFMYFGSYLRYSFGREVSGRHSLLILPSIVQICRVSGNFTPSCLRLLMIFKQVSMLVCPLPDSLRMRSKDLRRRIFSIFIAFSMTSPLHPNARLQRGWCLRTKVPLLRTDLRLMLRTRMNLWMLCTSPLDGWELTIRLMRPLKSMPVSSHASV